MAASSAGSELVISFLNLRRTIGSLGVLLPIVLALGCLIWGDCVGVQPSISDYYNTAMRDVFVGTLFAIGWFLFAYRGYERLDDLAGNFACVFALGVAVFPNTVPGSLQANLHYVSAACLFLILAYFSFFLFTKSGGSPTPQKIARNRIYRTCGVTIVVCIALIAMYFQFFNDSGLTAFAPVFWLESLALWAFGLSWFIKGETLLADPASP